MTELDELDAWAESALPDASVVGDHEDANAAALELAQFWADEANKTHGDDPPGSLEERADAIARRIHAYRARELADEER